MADTNEIVQTLEHLETTLEDLGVRGLSATGPQELAALRGLREELERIGADHLAGRIATLITAVENDDARVAAALLRAQASLRVFERILTLEIAAAQLQTLLQGADEDEA
jgi:hypothetical protein